MDYFFIWDVIVLYSIQYTGLGIGSSFLPKKVSEWAIPSKVSVSLIFGERPERFAHNYSFLLSDLNKLLKVAYLSWPTWAIRSLGSEGMRESFAFLKSFLKTVKTYKNTIFSFFLVRIARFCEQKSKRAIHSKKKVIHSFAYLLWVTWANHSHSLICLERFERMSKWAMSEWANSQPWYYRIYVTFYCTRVQFHLNLFVKPQVGSVLITEL